MINIQNKVLLTLAISIFASCSQVLETVSLELDNADPVKQEQFSVVEKTLTMSEAQAGNLLPFNRFVSQTGAGKDANLITEVQALISDLPEYKPPQKYKVGVGDTLAFITLFENLGNSNGQGEPWPDKIRNEPYRLGIGDQITLTQLNEDVVMSSALPSNLGANSKSSDQGGIQSLTTLGRPTTVNNIIQTSGRVGSDGSILLLEVGRLEALGKSINKLRSEVRNILIRNGISPKFQLEISAFESQKAYITITSNLSGRGTSSGKVIPLTDQPVTLREILSQLGIALKPGVSSRITLQRSQSKYHFDMEEIYSPTATDLIIKDLDHIFVDEGLSNVITSEVVVAYDGNILLPDLGKIKVAGKTLQQIEKEIRNLSQNNIDTWKNFQIMVTGFNSQKATISIENKEISEIAINQIIPITNIPINLLEAVISAGINTKKNELTKIHLTRNGNLSSLLLRDLLSNPTRKIFLEDGDLIRVQRLSYKPSKVFITGSGITPRIFNISPSNRETLADVLFTENGVLSSNSAKRSEVYLLRGRDPVNAYHLDALSPSRLIVAEAMELRPNDILFVAEKPINSFNRTLQTILPLRILLRDINDNNIP